MLTLGTNFYPAKGPEGKRQAAAQDSWRSLEGVDLIDLQFARDPAILDLPGFHRVEKLRHDSLDLTGISGKRKPIMSEMFDLLAREARTAGNRLFAFANADIVLPPEFVPHALECAAAGSMAQAFSRVDFGGDDGRGDKIIYPGQDVFVIDVQWWLENRWRFRPYIVGEVGWDNVYASILLRHAPGAQLHNRVGYIRHERHVSVWEDSPFAPYNTLLTILDSFYFRDWFDYCQALKTLRVGDQLADEAAERAAHERAFSWQPALRDRLVRWGRVARAYASLWGNGLRRGEFQPPVTRSAYAGE